MTRDTLHEPALERVLLATDFSPGASEAAAWAAEHLAPDTELVLAHAVDVPQAPSFLHRDLPSREELTAQASKQAKEHLKEAARALPRSPKEWKALPGRSAEALARLARETGADLMVVGAHGRREGLWADLGSTAAGLLAGSPIPVLVARGMIGGAPRHLLVPLDDSAESRHALAWAVFLAERLDARVTLLHVVSSGLLGSMHRISSERALGELDARMRTGVANWLDDLAAEAGLSPERVTKQVKIGVPALEILASAARLGCDLIVLGGRGSGGARLPALGGVAGAVVRHGTVPVLVVPGIS